MTEIRFYHLETKTLEQVLPAMLQMSLQRGWKVVVQAGTEERVEALSGALWTHADDSFIPHGSAADGFAGSQPVWLTAGADTPNGAKVRFFVDGAELIEPEGLDLAVIIFDGRDDGAVDSARQAWKAFRGAGHEISYWQQDEQGRWQNRAAQSSKAAVSGAPVA